MEINFVAQQKIPHVITLSGGVCESSISCYFFWS